MKTLEDYSGEFIPNIKLEQFSKKTLVKMLKLYSQLYIAVDGFWYLAVRERNGNEEALACDMRVWEKASRYETKHVMKSMNIKGHDVAALGKAFQVAPWFQSFEYHMDLLSKNNGILTVTKCPTLEALEKEGEGRENSICNIVEPLFFQYYATFVNPEMEVNCLKSPPRKSKQEVCCQWQFEIKK